MRRHRSHADMAKLIPHHELGHLDGQNARALEDHALDCDECFGELERGARIAAAMHEHRARFQGVLGGEATVPSQPRGAAAFRARLSRPLHRVAHLRPTFSIPLAAALLLVVVIGVRQAARSPSYHQLATFPREEGVATTVRGESTSRATLELVEAGAGYLDTGRYGQAERHFEAALARDPDLVEALYLLGLCRVFLEKTDSAIAVLSRAATLANGDMAPRVSWVLANAYLEAENPREAKLILTDLAAQEGRYQAAARDLLERLPR